MPGFDDSLFAELRRMTPRERLELNDRTIRTILELRRAFATVVDEPARESERGRR